MRPSESNTWPGSSTPGLATEARARGPGLLGARVFRVAEPPLCKAVAPVLRHTSACSSATPAFCQGARRPKGSHETRALSGVTAAATEEDRHSAQRLAIAPLARRARALQKLRASEPDTGLWPCPPPCSVGAWEKLPGHVEQVEAGQGEDKKPTRNPSRHSRAPTSWMLPASRGGKGIVPCLESM